MIFAGRDLFNNVELVGYLMISLSLVVHTQNGLIVVTTLQLMGLKQEAFQTLVFPCLCRCRFCSHSFETRIDVSCWSYRPFLLEISLAFLRARLFSIRWHGCDLVVFPSGFLLSRLLLSFFLKVQSNRI